MTLEEAIRDPARTGSVVSDCVRLIEDEVGSKRGLSGAAVRAAFAAFQRIRPGIVRAAVVRLLPDLATAIDPHWARAQESGDAEGYFRRNDRVVANDLLGRTDSLAARSQNRVLVKIYRSLRSSAQDHVAAAVPRLPPLIRIHTAGVAL